MNNVASAIYISTSIFMFFIVKIIEMYIENFIGITEKPAYALMKTSVYLFPYIPLAIGLVWEYRKRLPSCLF